MMFVRHLRQQTRHEHTPVSTQHKTQSTARMNCHGLSRKAIQFCTYASFDVPNRSEEHTSELQSLMRTSSAVLCLTKASHSTGSNSNNQNTPQTISKNN